MRIINFFVDRVMYLYYNSAIQKKCFCLLMFHLYFFLLDEKNAGHAHLNLVFYGLFLKIAPLMILQMRACVFYSRLERDASIQP